jgi:hypothetical protein
MVHLALGSLLIAGCNQQPAEVGEFEGRGNSGPRSGNDSAEQTRAAGQGPFGIEAGSPLAALDSSAKRDSETGVAILSNVPKPSSQFPLVAVVAFEETGVCEVRALSESFDSDTQLLSARGFADQIAQALESRYGKPKKQEGCSGYACRSQYPIQHVQDGTIWYGYEWRSTAQSRLPNRIKEIDLSVMHAEFNNSQVRLDYRFDNQEQCARARRSAQAEGL